MNFFGQHPFLRPLGSRSLLRRIFLLGVLGLSAWTLRGAAVPPVLLGSAWYPEHCSPQQIEADLALMEAGGLRMARIGEFAWSSMEPAEGRYTLEWLDQAIAAAAAHHVFIVLGTPSDAPPLWLEEKYPEILRIDVEGRRLKPGAGRAFSYANGKYRELCREIVERLAQRYGHNPNVIGWQIGNEPTEDSFDPAAKQDYLTWLRAKYGTVDSLNEHWQTWYWSHTYDRFDQVELSGNGGIPGQFLDYKRFISDEWARFHRNQAEAIRKYAEPRQFITTNFGGLGWADRFNRHQVAQEFSLVSWDNYVGMERFDPVRNTAGYTSLEHFDPFRNGATHDLARGWKQQNFWLMELQPAFVDWAPVSNALEPGVTRTMIWQAIGHGADGISFWQWRAAWNGDGQYHGTLVGPDTTPVPVFAEVKRAAGEVAAVETVLAGTTPRSEVAILHDYDSRWAIDQHRMTQRYDQIAVLLGYYRALRERSQSVDLVDAASDLSRYKLVLAPSLNVISPALAQSLEGYVRSGGHLLLGPRSGMKDEFNALNRQRQPGPLVPALGGRVEQYYALIDDVPLAGAWGTGQGTIWAEDLSTQAADAEVKLRYGAGNGWLAGHPAAIERKLGRGSLSYLGTIADLGVMRHLVGALADEAGVARPFIIAPANVEVCRRAGTDHEVWILINHGTVAASVELPVPMTDALNGSSANSAPAVRRVQLPAHEISVLTRPTPVR